MAAEKNGGVVPAESMSQKGGVVPQTESQGGVVQLANVFEVRPQVDPFFHGILDGFHDGQYIFSAPPPESSRPPEYVGWGKMLKYAHDNEAKIATTPTATPIPASNFCPADKIGQYEAFLLNLYYKSRSELISEKKGSVIPVSSHKGGIVLAADQKSGVVPV